MWVQYNDTVAIRVKDWIGAGLSRNQYEHDSKRGYLKIVKRSQHDETLIDAKSIILPERRLKLEAVYGKIDEAFKKGNTDSFASYIVTELKAQEFYNKHKKPNGENLSVESRRKYYNNAIILNAIREFRSIHRMRRRGKRPLNLWQNLSNAVNNLDVNDYPHNLPGNPRRLQDKYKEYIKWGYIALVHGSEGNGHALKINDDKKEKLLRELFNDHRNLDDTQVQMLFNMVSEPMGWTKITAGTVANWREKLHRDTFVGARGVTAHRNKIAMQVKRKAPTAPLFYWTLDGWDAELLYQMRTRDKSGRSIVTYHNRPNVVVVLDPFTKYPVGYAIGTHETPELIKSALRNALNHIKDLFGTRYKPHQLQTDRYSISALKFLYEGVTDKYTPARVKNSKAKVIEPYFASINKKYCHLMPNWSGYGVTAGKDKQPNDEYLNKIRHNFPEQQDCYAQIEGIINLERKAKRDQYLEAFAELPESDKLIFSNEMYLQLFGETTGFTNRLQGPGLLPTIQGNTYTYDSFNPEFRNYGYVDWMVKYDPEDLSNVLVVNARYENGKPVEIGTLRFMLTQKYVQPMALKDRKEGDAAELAKVNQFNKALETEITERRALSTATVNELFEHNPQLNNTLAKLMLVDSRGQHKDRKNELRMAQPEDIEPVPVPAASNEPASEEYTEIIDDPLDFIRNNF